MRRLSWNRRRRRRLLKLVGGSGTLWDGQPELTVGDCWPFAHPCGITSTGHADAGATQIVSGRRLCFDRLYSEPERRGSNEFVADRDSLPKVKIANREGFIRTDPGSDAIDSV
jgi:hypothetical protein